MVLIPKSPFILVDGSSYLFRAFYALPPLATSTGQPTGAIYGVVNMLKRLISTYEPALMAVVFDTKGPTFRHEAFPAYKANRTTMPDELAEQIEPLHEIIQAMGLKLLAVSGVEADDVIGTLTRAAQAQKMFTLISTGDKDLAQLVDKRTVLINTLSDKIYDIQGVQEKFQVSPDKMIDYLALTGDTVDNIPGVPKVGPKTAVKWLQQYGSLAEVIAHADDIKGKVGDNLRQALTELPLYESLVTIKTDVDLPLRPEDLTIEPPDEIKLQDWFTKMEFKRWLKDEVDSTDKQKNYQTIFAQTELTRWIQKIKKSQLLSVDVETTSLNYMEAKLVGISLCCKAGEAVYIPFGHDNEEDPDQTKQLDQAIVLKKLKPLLEDPNIGKIGHNLKYDAHVLANYNINLQGLLGDTMLGSYVFNSIGTRHDMDSVAKKYLQIETISYETVAGKGAKQLPFNQVHIKTAMPYAAEDADVAFRLYQYLWPKIKEHDGLNKIFSELEMPLLSILLKIERWGVLIDSEKLAQQSKNLSKKLTQLENQAHQLADKVFNLNSPKQLQEILYEDLGLPVLQKTPKGQPSTAESVLQELAVDYELPEIILTYRSLNKLKTTYADSLPEQINQQTGRIHTSYHQAVTATGRLSSTEPNLQNIPVKTEEGKKIREAFIAPRGYVLVSADYSQIELRIMAHLSEDPGLIHAFEEGIDIHCATAAEVFHVAPGKVTELQRRQAKAINFGLIYGMSAFGLSKQLGISRKEADLYIDTYFDKFPKVKDFMKQVRLGAQKKRFC